MNNRTYPQKKKSQKLKQSKADVRRSDTTLILNAWKHFTFRRRWVYTEESTVVEYFSEHN